MKPARSRAFTLLEVMLALSLSLLLAWSIMAIVTNLSDRRDRVVRLASTQEQAGTLFDLLERDLLCCVAARPDGAAGLFGSSSSITITSRWAQVRPAGSPDGGTPSSTYRFDAATGRILLRREPAGEPEETAVEHVERFALRYYDGQTWHTDFNSAGSGRLPAAVEVALWFLPTSTQAAVEPSGAPERLPDRVRQIPIPDNAGSSEGGRS